MSVVCLSFSSPNNHLGPESSHLGFMCTVPPLSRSPVGGPLGGVEGQGGPAEKLAVGHLGNRWGPARPPHPLM